MLVSIPLKTSSFSRWNGVDAPLNQIVSPEGVTNRPSKFHGLTSVDGFAEGIEEALPVLGMDAVDEALEELLGWPLQAEQLAELALDVV